VRGFAVYTGLRVLLLVAVWVTLQLVTPLRGLIAIAIAFVVSGIIGFFLLNRPRDDASVSLSRVFGRINARIDAGTKAEDAAAVTAAGLEVLSGGPQGSGGQGEPDAEENPVAQGEDTGELKDGDEGLAAGSLSDDQGSAHGDRHSE
jgi:hypothetical protein